MNHFNISLAICLMYISTLFGADQHIYDRNQAEKIVLKQQLNEEVTNLSYAFDLALIYQDLQKLNKAISLYHKAKYLKDDRGWYSEFMLGQCYEKQNNWKRAHEHYDLALNRKPLRAEPLYNIAYHYFNENEHSKVCLVANRGRKIPIPLNDNLFVKLDVYKYKFQELLSVSSYYDSVFIKKGTKYIDELLYEPTTPKPVKENCFKNLLFYVESLDNVHYIPMNVTTPLLCDWSIERYKPYNPAIVKTKKGYVTICRSSNCVQWYPDYVVMDGTGMPKTKNIYIEYDKNLNKGFESLVFEDPSIAKCQTRIQGLEDLRLFHYNDEIYFVATSCQLNPQGIPKMCCGKFEINKNEDTIKVNKLTSLRGPILERPEKNWMPLVIDGELLLIYSFDPYIIYKPNLETGECKELIRRNPDFDFSRFAGSAPPIPFDDGYLLMVHEGIWLERKYYIHRFVYLDKNLDIKKVSRPFTFKHKGVEMCCGMVINHEEDKLIMMIALEDREAYFGLIDLHNVRSLLKNLPKSKL